jgi:uncharacterized repeat protein (TIGR04138 family)
MKLDFPLFKKDVYFVSEKRERYSYNAYVLVEEAIIYKLQREGVNYVDGYDAILEAFLEYVLFIFGELAEFVLKKLGILEVGDVITIFNDLRRYDIVEVDVEKECSYSKGMRIEDFLKEGRFRDDRR